MKFRKRYRLQLEDEAYLRTVVETEFSAAALWTVVAGAVVLFLLLAGLIIFVTPLRTLLPGYMKESQRAATEENLLRLDSLQEAYRQKQEYIDNFLRVIDSDRLPTDSLSVSRQSLEMTGDSLMTSSERERRFVSDMAKRERYNISVLAPLAADGIMFNPVNSEGVFTSDSRDSEEGKVLLGVDAAIQSPADGSVLAVYYSAADRGYAILVQHQRGFVSAVARTGTPLVGTGDEVSAGQMIALPPTPDSHGRRYVTVRMWHNGLPIAPYKYIGNPAVNSLPKESYEAPRGKF